ncbi:MAG: YraN family protein [Candidatus Doudnabacteria bacterium]|nr:YraN family protein [Candidatus Doudnabacteria bacterium]
MKSLKTGEAGETWTAYVYRLNGHRILARNYAIFGKKKLGEIDIVCKKGRRLVFVEVKTRRDDKFMSIVEAVNFRKQSYLRRMAKLFLQQNPHYENYEIQIDIAAVLLGPFDNIVKSVKLIENAIEDSA